MNSRFFIYLTFLAVGCMAILVGYNLIPLIETAQEEDSPLSFYDIRGIDVEHQQLSYPLNFTQQNEIIAFLNRAIPVGAQYSSEGSEEVDFDKMTIHLFDAPDLILIPKFYSDGDLIFSIPSWNENGLMKDVSRGKLQTLISHTYDP